MHIGSVKRIRKAQHNCFETSELPAESFGYGYSLERFTVLSLQPFSKEQAIELIHKLEFRTDIPAIKERFIERLDHDLFETHKEFAENPLLLTIMLMTFEEYADVPLKMHIFYREAYWTLAKKHDASKGAYTRPLKTGLTVEKFEKYLAEFCAKTYYYERYEFTDEEIASFFYKLKERQRNQDSQFIL